MPRYLPATILTFFFLPAIVTAQEDGWHNLVTGTDLVGWTSLNGEAPYRVEENIIVGTTVMGTPNTFLATNKAYGDFSLSVDVMVDTAINSGIQVRSLSLPSVHQGRVHGYQVEIDPSDRAWSGGIYDEARRGWLYPLTLNQDCRTAFNNGAWNHYYIEAIGHSIRTWINDVPCAALYDDVTQEGFIALQVHSIDSDDMAGREVRWRNIRLKTDNLEPRPWTDTYVVNLIPNTLSSQEEAQGWQLLFDGTTTAGWRGAGKETFPEKGWNVREGILMVEASGGGEATYGGDIVTMDEYSMFEFSLDFKLAEGANSGIKYFITESYGSNASAIGLEYQLLDDERHPDAMQGTAGNRTVASLYDLIPADPNKTIRGPGQWNRARIVVSGTRIDEHVKGSQLRKSTFTGAHVEHWLNDRRVLAYERGTPSFSALVARSKYAVWEEFGNWSQGHILLQDHGDEVYFRSIKVRPLSGSE